MDWIDGFASVNDITCLQPSAEERFQILQTECCAADEHERMRKLCEVFSCICFRQCRWWSSCVSSWLRENKSAGDTYL